MKDDATKDDVTKDDIIRDRKVKRRISVRYRHIEEARWAINLVVENP